MKLRHASVFSIPVCVVTLTVILVASGAAATDDHLLLCEAVLTPTDGEYLEIVNPTTGPVALDQYYLSDDEDYALLPGAFGAGPAPAIGSTDFIVQFPPGASIASDAVVVVAFSGSGFETTYGFKADFEIMGTDAGTPDMIATNVGATAGLTNSGENAVLFVWDGVSDLIQDVDMVNLGTPSASNDIADKTLIAVDGPDGDTTTTNYAVDGASMPQQAADPGFGSSTKRIFGEAGTETNGGGNGLTGDDETTEAITSTWDGPTFTAPDPGVCGIAVSGPADPLINEFVANHTGTDTSEFVEIFGEPSADYSSFTIVEIEGDGTSAGLIDDGTFALGTTDASGYWTTGFVNNVYENGSLTVLLVEGFTGTVGDDLDTNDDGVFDVTPWTRIIDDVAVDDGGSSDRHFSTTVLDAAFDGGSFAPGGASRIPNGTDTDTIANWVRNDFDGEGLPGFTGTLVAGEALNTPGAENSAVVAVADPLINEFVASHLGTDTHEFVEIFGDPNTDYSAFTIVEIEGEVAGHGSIDDGIFSVGTTDADGYWTTSFQYNVLENGSATLLLVEGFTGSVGQDLDTNDDGVFDVTPWTRIVDDVAVDYGGASDRLYSTSVLAEGYDGMSFTPGGASRIPNGTDTDTVSDWMRNDFFGEGLPGFTGDPVVGVALNTPGAENVAFTIPRLLLTEIVVTPTGGEFVEIHNPGGSAVDLSDYYLTDATFAGGGVYYYNVVTGANAGGGGFDDFHARFPDGATIGPGEYQTVAIAGSVDFFSTYGVDPTYELYEDGGATESIPEMREALAGSIADQGGFSNDGEVAVLYFWDGVTDLVTDIDYAVWGDKAEAVDKTGVAVDGPDGDSATTAYQNDTAIATQDVVSLGGHSSGESFGRVDLTEGAETTTGGNGVNGNDETSENLSVTWAFSTPSPNAETPPPPVFVVINEILADPASGLAGDANGDGTRDSTDDEFVEIVNTDAVDLDISGWTLSDGFGLRHTFPASTILPAGCGIVVFGGGTPTGGFGGVLVQTASTGALGFNNGGDTVTLANGTTDVVSESYGSEGGDNQSLTRDPDLTGAFVKHSLAAGAGGSLFSPGTRLDGAPFGGCFAAVGVVINEVDADTAGSDALEFIELYGAPNTPLDGVVVVLFNGNGDVSYAAYDLDGFALDGNGFFVLGNAAVANVDLVIPNSSLQNGADGVAVYRGDGADFPNGTAVTVTGLLDALVYDTNDGDDAGLLVLLNPGQPQINEGGGGDKDNHSNSRVPDGGAQRDTSSYVQQQPTPGITNVLPLPYEIFEIQGAGLLSPFDGVYVITADNVVTGVGTVGFTIQTPPERVDADPATSEGVYVFVDGPPSVAVGDRVTVTATVQEFFELTELTNVMQVDVLSSGNPLPAPVVFDGVTPSPDPATPTCLNGLECFEGMRVTVAAGFVAGPNQSFGSDNVAEAFVIATPGPRPFREKGILFPGLPGLPVFDGNPEIFELDQDRLGLSELAIGAGSSFTATGVVGYEFGDYELWATDLTVTPVPYVAPVRDRAPGELTIASLNMFRLFDDVADGSEYVSSTLDYQTRLASFALYVIDVLGAPDVLGVQEAEKAGVLDDLAAAIAALDPSIVYSSHLVPGNDIGGINVGFMVRDTVNVAQVTQLGAAETFDFGGNTGYTLHDRPPLLLEGSYIANGVPFDLAVMVNHTRSRNSIEDDAGSGPFVRQKRYLQAQSIAEKVQDFQTAHPTIPLAVLGDFNAFQYTDGYVDVVGQIAGDFDPSENLISGPDLVDPNLSNQVLSLPFEQQYSYIYRGSSEALDHILTSDAAATWVRGFEYGRANADAPAHLIDEPTIPDRSSDHDGCVLYLMTDADGDGIPDDLDVADLVVTKTAGNPNAFAGSPMSYTVTATNLGPSAVIGASVIDTFPVELQNPTWTCVATAGSSSTPAGAGDINDPVTLLAGGSATYSITTTIDPTFAGELVNTASVIPPVDTPDPDLASNEVSAAVTVTLSTDLAIALVQEPVPALFGLPLELRATVTNLGPSAATGVEVTLATRIGGFSVESAGSSAGTCVPNVRGAICTIDPMDPGAVETIFVSGTPYKLGRGQASATVEAATPDPVSLNNSASLIFSVEPAADVWVELTDLGTTGLAVAGPRTFEVVYGNEGPSTATHVVLGVDLPDGSSDIVLAGNTAGCEVVGAAVLCEPADLTVPPGNESPVKAGLLVIHAELPAGDPLTVVSTIQAAELDPETTNNFDQITTAGWPSNLVPNPAPIQLRVAPGDSSQVELTLTNLGPSAISWALDTLDRRVTPGRAVGSRSDAASRVPEDALQDRDARAVVVPIGGGPAGVVVEAVEPTSRTTTVVPDPWGVTFDRRTGELLVTAAEDGLVERFAVAGGTPGVSTVSADADAWSADGIYDDLRDSLWLAAVGGPDCLAELGLPDGEPTGYRVCSDAATSLRAVAHDPSTGLFYVGSWTDGVIRVVDRAGIERRSYDTGLNVAGIVLDSAGRRLLVSTNGDGAFDLVALDLDRDLEPVAGYDVTDMDDFGQAGITMACDGRVWLVDRIDGDVLEIDLGTRDACDVLRAVWLTVSAGAGSVDAGSTVSLDLQVDGAGLEPGLHRAWLRLLTDDSTNALLIPVDLTVGFVDVGADHWAGSVVHGVAGARITGSCGDLRFCPSATITRAGMAEWLVRTWHGASFVTDGANGTVFDDVGADHPAAAFIETLAADGLTAGCGAGLYCPDGQITRAQMAVFVLRVAHGPAWNPPVAAGVVFDDVPANHWAASWIEALYREGITAGCGDEVFCPDRMVSRAEMAAFMVRAFTLPTSP